MSELIKVLKEAHIKACHRENVSTQILKASFIANGRDLPKAICSAIMSLGGPHAPIKDAYCFISDCMERFDEDNIQAQMIRWNPWPGFGSSFEKGFDPLLEEIESVISAREPETTKLWEMINRLALQKGKILYPNLAFYTAATCMIEGIKVDFCEKLLLEARIPEWIKILEQR